MAFSREILYTRLFPLFSYQAYKSYVRQIFGEMNDDFLLKNYERYTEDNDFFVHETLGAKKGGSVSYLLSPLRGLLAVYLMLVSFASAIYFMIDEKKGTFVWVRFNSGTRKMFFQLFVQLIPVLDAAIVVFFSIFAAGLFTDLLSEIVSLVLFAISSVAFSNMIRHLAKNEVRFCAVLPVLILALLVICPVFIKIDRLRPLQYLFPPFSYLKSDKMISL